MLRPKICCNIRIFFCQIFSIKTVKLKKKKKALFQLCVVGVGRLPALPQTEKFVQFPAYVVFLTMRYSIILHTVYTVIIKKHRR